MKNLLALSLCLGLIPLARADEAKPTKKLLVITESRGYRHSVVARGKNGELSLAEKVLTKLGKDSGSYEATCSQDSRSMITAENLKQYDAVFFYTTGSLPLSDTQKADLLGFIRSGKGFAGSHSATDTFYDWPEYGKLIGGYFNGHPWHRKIRVIVEDKKHPATKHLGDSFEITDEIYQFKEPYNRKNLRILMRMDMAIDKPSTTVGGKKLAEGDEVTLTVKGGKASLEVNGKSVDAVGFSYAGRQGARKDRDNALAWIHEFGKGRVFYTALGHREDVWEDTRFQKHILGGLRYVLGLEKADATPSAEAKK
jgi:uncharacterized protein